MPVRPTCPPSPPPHPFPSHPYQSPHSCAAANCDVSGCNNLGKCNRCALGFGRDSTGACVAVSDSSEPPLLVQAGSVAGSASGFCRTA